MASKRFAAAIVLVVLPALLLIFLSNGGVRATELEATYSVTLADTTADANPGLTTSVFIFNPNPSPNTDNNFGTIRSTTGVQASYISLDSAIPDGADVGGIASATTLSIFGGPCSTDITVNIPFMDCTTDVRDTADWEGGGDNLVQDDDNDGTAGEAEDSNGIPTYCDHYPSYLNEMFDPDGPGGLDPIRPLARYSGHSVVVEDAPATQLSFVVFAPEALSAMPTVDSQIPDTSGYLNVVVLNNPVGTVAPSTITDFCTPLTSIPVLEGTSDAEYQVTPGPPPYEVDRIGQCGDASDNDGDTFVDDGCLTQPDPCDGSDNDSDTVVDEGCGFQRGENPAPLTGIWGTGTHIVPSYTQGQRDVDVDNLSNNLDSCPYLVNNNVDADGDGLDSACDPDDNTPSLGAPAPNGVDDDSDTLTDEDPVDNVDNDGDTAVDEDGECAATSGIPDEDQDCYTNRQDNCPLLPNDQSDTDTPSGTAPADLGPLNDGIGDACDLQPAVEDGHYEAAMPYAYICIPDPNGGDDWDSDGDSDDDDDGVCDSTEILLGSDPDNSNSTPEHEAIDIELGTGTAAEAPGTCNDFTLYNHPDSGPIDNDLDGDVNGDDSDCQSPADTDRDGVEDAADNCPAAKNPTQQDSDGDGIGDDCDADDDGDGISDGNESCMGLDPKDNAADDTADDANPYDFDNNTVVDVTDALTFLAKFPSAVTNPGDERFDYTCAGADNVVDVTDALTFLAKFPSDTKTSIQFTNNTGQAVDDIHIEFLTPITRVSGASGGWGPTGAVSPPSSSIDLSGGALANGGTLTVTAVGRRPPVYRCYDWTSGGSVVDGSDQPCRVTGSPTDGFHFTFPTTAPQAWSAVWGGPPIAVSQNTIAGPDRYHTMNVDLPPPANVRLTSFPGGPISSLAKGDDGAWDPVIGAPANSELAGGLADCNGAGDGVDDDGPDGWFDDGCPIDGDGVGEKDYCWNNDDDDADAGGEVNDGCPAVGAPEAVCGPAVDDDLDGWINDGCAAVGAAETALDECGFGDNVDDDGDTDTNDGCRPKP